MPTVFICRLYVQFEIRQDWRKHLLYGTFIPNHPEAVLCSEHMKNAFGSPLLKFSWNTDNQRSDSITPLSTLVWFFSAVVVFVFWSMQHCWCTDYAWEVVKSNWKTPSLASVKFSSQKMFYMVTRSAGLEAKWIGDWEDNSHLS